MTTLTARGVDVRFDGLHALKGIDLDIKQGEILGLLGPNGAGKTTMVNVLTGFQAPAAGIVMLDSQVISGKSPGFLASIGIARTFQSVRLFKRLTVLENIEVAAQARQHDQARARRAAMTAASFMGLETLLHRQAGSLPYVDERRVGIARALALAPLHLLLDEPAAGMTEGECDVLVRTISRLPSEFGCGVLLIEHNMNVVMSVCSQLHVLNNGLTLAVGEAEMIRTNPAVIEAYMGAG
jgi:branched-chain amino acid transport system ATP-binding protein